MVTSSTKSSTYLRLIEFQSPTSRKLLPATRTDLSSLIYPMFWGISEYFEDFVGRINAPRLKEIYKDYFNQLVEFEYLQLRQFIERLESLI